jgi:DNA-binding transcriptional MerR regulator
VIEALPKKLYYKIGEVCDLCQIQPHVLRYWETEFSQLAPTKNTSGQRMYRYKDVLLVRRIKQLLYEEGYTIAGANKKLATDNVLEVEHNRANRAEEPGGPEKAAMLPLFSPAETSGTGPAADGQLDETIESIRRELGSILDMLRDE